MFYGVFLLVAIPTKFIKWYSFGSCAKVGDYAKRLDNLNKKKSIFLTPLNWDLKAFIFALKDSAEALVLLLSK